MDRWHGTAQWWRSPLLHDVLIAVTILAATVGLLSTGDLAVTRPTGGQPGLLARLLAAAAAGALVWRRRAPVAVLAVTTAAMAVLALVDGPLGVPLAPGVALYTLAVQRPHGGSAARLATLVAVPYLAYVAACAAAIAAVPWSELLHTALLWVAFWLAGERTRLQKHQLEELRRRAVSGHALAVAEERARIARDLHDSVGHAINVIAVRAGAARLRHEAEPHRSLDALRTIEDVARRTVAEIDELVGALRAGFDDASPASVRSIPTLLRHHHEAGLAVAIEVIGDERHLPATVDRAAYRIVQAGLTNASRHGRGQADVQLHYGADNLSITICNLLGSTAGGGRRGYGLVGAAERAGIVGGTLSAGPEGGTFVLAATLPTGPAATVTRPAPARAATIGPPTAEPPSPEAVTRLAPARAATIGPPTAEPPSPETISAVSDADAAR